MTEHVLVVLGELPGRAPDDPLAVLEQVEPTLEQRPTVPAQERLRPLGPERLPEDARRAQDLPRLGLDALEARLEHRDHARGELGVAVGRRPNALLEVKGVPGGALNHPLEDGGGDVGPERLADELRARLGAELVELELLGRAPAPEAGEEIVDRGPREGEDEERTFGEVSEREVHEADGEHVSPVEIFEDEDQRPALALGGDEVEPRLLHLVAHQLRVLPRSAEPLARRVAGGRRASAGLERARRGAEDLAQELGDPRHLRLVRDALGDPPSGRARS